ncbi:MAG: ATP-binding protein, partial [Polaromonas sp.]|nr:ATP-binding protein [Polaromonas sp.]
LDNVLGNVSSLSRERMIPANCSIVITQDAQNTLVAVETRHLRLEIPLEKLFEPWSSSGPANKGLGMYQARKQAQAAGGDLFAETVGTGLRVVLSIPL